jgi:hypothetical protein
MAFITLFYFARHNISHIYTHFLLGPALTQEKRYEASVGMFLEIPPINFLYNFLCAPYLYVGLCSVEKIENSGTYLSEEHIRSWHEYLVGLIIDFYVIK